jgi:hypothetical protein
MMEYRNAEGPRGKRADYISRPVRRVRTGSREPTIDPRGLAGFVDQSDQRHGALIPLALENFARLCKEVI